MDMLAARIADAHDIAATATPDILRLEIAIATDYIVSTFARRHHSTARMQALRNTRLRACIATIRIMRSALAAYVAPVATVFVEVTMGVTHVTPPVVAAMSTPALHAAMHAAAVTYDAIPVLRYRAAGCKAIWAQVFDNLEIEAIRREA